MSCAAEVTKARESSEIWVSGQGGGPRKRRRPRRRVRAQRAAALHTVCGNRLASLDTGDRKRNRSASKRSRRVEGKGRSGSALLLSHAWTAAAIYSGKAVFVEGSIVTVATRIARSPFGVQGRGTIVSFCGPGWPENGGSRPDGTSLSVPQPDVLLCGGLRVTGVGHLFDRPEPGDTGLLDRASGASGSSGSS
ncbi:hypothetical protein MTO96_015286 [Rhipicephalus appendiculatus]